MKIGDEENAFPIFKYDTKKQYFVMILCYKNKTKEIFYDENIKRVSHCTDINVH